MSSKDFGQYSGATHLSLEPGPGIYLTILLRLIRWLVDFRMTSHSGSSSIFNGFSASCGTSKTLHQIIMYKFYPENDRRNKNKYKYTVYIVRKAFL